MKSPLKNSFSILLGVLQHFLNASLGQSVVGTALRWHRLRVISCGTARDCGHSLYPRLHPPSHPQSLASKNRGCRCLAPGMPKCQLGGFGTRNLFFYPSPAVTTTKAEPLFLKLISQGNKIASPPVFTAEGRGQREGMALWDTTSRKWSCVCQRWDANMTEEAVVCMR